jgi:hypothetical protein
MRLKEAISLVILRRARGRMREVAIYFENAPFAFSADEEIGFTVLSCFKPQPREAVREKEHLSTVKLLGDADFGLRAEAEIVPGEHRGLGGQLPPLIGDSISTESREQFPRQYAVTGTRLAFTVK